MVLKAFVFPGQGSQYVGMAKDLYDNYPEAALVFYEADEALGFRISDICFEGPEETLKQTIYTQPAILTASIACFNVLKEKGVNPDFVAGHSLGEYSAAVAAGSLEFKEAVKLVYKRGQYMEEAVPHGKGTMAAILGLAKEEVKKLCLKVSEKVGVVQPANYNCPGQVVVAGETAAVKELIKLATERGAKRAVPLKVSGPFHSSLMTPAADKLAQELSKINFKDPQVPLVANYSGDVIKKKEQLIEGLKKQINNPVQWEKSVETMIEKGVTYFFEIGPGKVLSGLIKKINSRVVITNVEDNGTLIKTLEKWGK